MGLNSSENGFCPGVEMHLSLLLISSYQIESNEFNATQRKTKFDDAKSHMSASSDWASESVQLVLNPQFLITLHHCFSASEVIQPKFNP